MRHSPPSFLLLALLIAGLVLLGACRNPVTPDPDPTPDPVDPPTDPVDPAPNPTPPVTHEVGRHAISGLETIPTDMIQVTKKEMQSMWVVADTSDASWHSPDDDNDLTHAGAISSIACHSYLVMSSNCELSGITTIIRNTDDTITSNSGTAPFTGLFDFKSTNDFDEGFWFGEEVRKIKPKIVSLAGLSLHFFLDKDPDPSYLIIQAAGNYKSDYIGEQSMPVDHELAINAVKANKLIYIAGWDKDENGNYVRNFYSSGCKYSDDKLNDELDGCLWTRFEFDGGGGTSVSSQNFAAALASVLAVFPDTLPQDLAKFGKSCAKKSGEGIEALLRQSGGVGVADFNCMGGVVDALVNLPTGGSTDVSINGQRVTVGGRELSLGFAGHGLYRHLLWPGSSGTGGGTDGPGGRTAFNVLPTGAGTGLFSLTHLRGEWFAGVAAGNREDFFGYSYGHDEVREWRLTTGHRNLFATLSKQSSAGSDFIDSAAGRALSLTVQQYLSLTDNTHAVVSAVADRFLGGKANIPVGNIKLNGGGWNNRISVDTKTALGRNAAFSASATYHSPEHGEDGYTLSAGLHWRF